MLETYNTSYLKQKFATLLSKLYTNAKIDYTDISEKLIRCDFLDMFENNDIKYFIDSSYEKMIYDLFKKEPVFDEDLNAVIYWCGLEYMNIFLNKRIPLKQLILMCPLQDMIKLFDVFHETSDAKYIEYFMNMYYQNSILSELRSRKGYTFNQLSFITNISVNTLKYLEYDNDSLYNTAFENINSIAKALDVDYAFFKKKSDFVINSELFYEDKQMFDYIRDYLSKYYKGKDVISEYKAFYVKSKNEKMLVDDAVIKTAINNVIDNYEGEVLLF